MNVDERRRSSLDVLARLLGAGPHLRVAAGARPGSRCDRAARASCPPPRRPRSRRARPPCRRAAGRSGGRRSRTSRRRASSTSPNLAMPDDLELLRRARAPRRRSGRRPRSPRRRRSPSSIDDLVRARGQRPSTRLSGLKRSYSGAVSMPKPKSARRRVSIALPSGRSSSSGRPVDRCPSATSTPSSARTSSSDASRDAARLRRSPSKLEAASLPVTTASVPGVRLDEDRVERLVDRVGEDVGAADHRDAEHDRERGQRRPELAAQQAL